MISIRGVNSQWNLFPGFLFKYYMWQELKSLAGAMQGLHNIIAYNIIGNNMIKYDMTCW